MERVSFPTSGVFVCVCFLSYNLLRATNCRMQFWLWHVSLRFTEKIKNKK